MPEAGVVRHEKTDKIPYREWQRAGWLKVTEGDVTDYDAIRTDTHDSELAHGWRIPEFAVDA
jgi:phage terminase large subunit-like protein